MLSLVESVATYDSIRYAAGATGGCWVGGVTGGVGATGGALGALGCGMVGNDAGSWVAMPLITPEGSTATVGISLIGVGCGNEIGWKSSICWSIAATGTAGSGSGAGAAAGAMGVASRARPASLAISRSSKSFMLTCATDGSLMGAITLARACGGLATGAGAGCGIGSGAAPDTGGTAGIGAGAGCATGCGAGAGVAGG